MYENKLLSIYSSVFSRRFILVTFNNQSFDLRVKWRISLKVRQIESRRVLNYHFGCLSKVVPLSKSSHLVESAYCLAALDNFRWFMSPKHAFYNHVLLTFMLGNGGKHFHVLYVAWTRDFCWWLVRNASSYLEIGLNSHWSPMPFLSTGQHRSTFQD